MNYFKLITLSAIFATASALAAPAESITITVSGKPATEGKLAVGGTRTLVAVTTPADASDPVTWSSSEPDIIAFDKTVAGKIRGMRPGTTVITAKAGAASAQYTVTVSLKDPKVGQYFFSDNTWEASGIVSGKTCVGVIFYIDPNDKRTGKIVSLDEAPNLKWSSEDATSPAAENALNGWDNLAKISAIPGWQNDFDAEAWCVDKNVADVKWYLPALDELRQLFAASCGLRWVESGADEAAGEINNWTGNSVTMLPGDNIDPYPAERAAFNQYFTKIGATPLTADKYWSSTEFGEQFAQFLSFEGGYSNLQPKQYFHICRTRAIATFSEKGFLSAVSDIAVDAPAADAPVEYYNLQGVRIPANALTPGLYIRRQGPATTKVLIK